MMPATPSDLFAFLDRLGIAHDTVRTHVRNAMGKTGARSRAHLVAKAIGEGYALR